MIRDYETKLFSEKHTKTLLDQEKIELNKKLHEVKMDNASMGRDIQMKKKFNKGDEQKRQKKEKLTELQTVLKKKNKKIEELDVNVNKEETKLNDKNLTKKQKEVTMSLN